MTGGRGESAGRGPDYELRPTIPLPEGAVVTAGDDVWRAIAAAVDGVEAPTVVVDAYPGIETGELIDALAASLPRFDVVDAETAALPIERIDALLAPFLTDDRVFGVMSHLPLASFYDADAVGRMRADLAERRRPVIVVGWGASLVAPDADLLVLADLARWEIQRRQRAGAPNWRAGNGDEDQLRKYKRGYFVEWRTADEHKRTLFDRVDLVLDTTRGAVSPTLVTGDAFRGALAAAARAPFRLVPFFDPGVWGGQWMKQHLGLDPDEANYAWCFDCVPEENSLLLAARGGAGYSAARGAAGTGGSGPADTASDPGPVVEIPALDLVLRHPRALLGELTFARFGAEFPIRFDFLDTMGGQNLSLQVHPLTDYIRREFGMAYTQDESYYLLDAGPDATVYLGLRDDVDPAAMERDLREAAAGGEGFPAERYVNRFPAAKHDHFAIPAGTVHCSGADSMVLEISATPFIFTFKLWDWGRVGLDGVPRPVHLEHGLANIQWDRRTDWVRENLVGRVETIAERPGAREERTGTHELEFIDVRRHWFDRDSERDTRGTVHVLNLVEGAGAWVTSPDGAFPPFAVHYAETVVVPAAVGRYVVSPRDPGATVATVTASVRGTALDPDEAARLAGADAASVVGAVGATRTSDAATRASDAANAPTDLETPATVPTERSTTP